MLFSTCNPQLSLDLNWTGVSRLFLLFTWAPRYLRPSTNDHTHLYRGDMRADLTYFMTLVDGNHLLISASSFQIYPSSHTTRFLAFATHLADSFVYNKSNRVSLLSFSIILDLTSHTQTRNIHRHIYMEIDTEISNHVRCSQYHTLSQLLLCFGLNRRSKWNPVIMKREDF